MFAVFLYLTCDVFSAWMFDLLCVNCDSSELLLCDQMMTGVANELIIQLQCNSLKLLPGVVIILKGL